MSITYNPDDPLYADADDVSREIDRVFDICHGCRVCFSLCPSFTDLFNSIDAHDGRVSELTPEERDGVISECYQCKLCALRCPYVPPHEWLLDFPKLMLRAAIQKKNSDPPPFHVRLADSVMSRTDLSGRFATAFSGLVNPVVTSKGGLIRKAMESVSGIASQRLLPPYAKRRFSTWFKRDHVANRTATGNPGREKTDNPMRSVALFPTCFVEYMDPEIGKDLVGVLEHAGASCTLPSGTQCCGAPWLHSGHIEQFRQTAAKNIEALRESATNGAQVIVPQATCAYVMRKDYPELIDSSDARVVADAVREPMEYLIGLRKGNSDLFDSLFPPLQKEGSADGADNDLSIVYHVSCHTQAQGVGLKARDLFGALGFSVKLVNKCAGIDGTWGYKSKNYALAKKVAQPMKRAIDDAAPREVCGDCHLANYAILEETGLRSVHPIQILARAYGIRSD